MTDSEPGVDARHQNAPIVAELESEGFEDARKIGQGGFGVVYRCLERDLDRVVAVKVLSANFDSDSRARFLREQRAMGRLSGHPNIVDVLHTGVTSTGCPYIVMPYHRRDSLEASIRRDGPVGWHEALRVGVKLVGALETAHRVGILHRDVKPANILLTEYGEPQLSDFGIARVPSSFETGTGVVTGSPAFTAPEVLAGESPTIASEIYGLGATLFCLITGHVAFERRAGERLVSQFLRISSKQVPEIPREGIPDDVCAAVERAMARDPADRPTSAAEFGEQLRELQRRHGLDVDQIPLPAALRLEEPPSPKSTGSPSKESGDQATQLGEGSRRYPTRSHRYPMRRPPSASTKYRPPTVTRALVERDRLVERLHGAHRRRLIVIHGPAGFGKSTLATQWRDALVDEGVHVAWLSIDSDDNNVVWFLAHLVESIRRVRSDLAGALDAALEEQGDEAERYVLTSLLNEIHDRGTRLVVVIDDWSRVTDPATIDAMAFLLDNGCHHLQIVVTSRTQSGLPLGRMRVRDELVEIDSAALRFDADESKQFLVDIGGLVLEPENIADLCESTDGWIAALQLASLSLRGRADPTEFISHLSGRHRVIAEYLAENVLNTLEPEILEFMLATSVSKRICGDLASALTHADRGQALLEEIEERDLFLHALDENRKWFRYHHLFADFLQRRLERDQPERLTELHRRASRWFADDGQLSEAVDHSLAAGDEDRAVDLVEDHASGLIEHSQMATLLGLIAKVPSQLVNHRPRLKLAEAWAHVLLHHDPAVVQTAVESLDASLERLPATGDNLSDMLVEASLIRGVAAAFEDRIDGVDQRVSDCLVRQDTLRPFVLSVAADLASFEAIYHFDFDAARRWQDWAAPFHARTIGPLVPMYGYCFAGIAAKEQLDIEAAESYFRQALKLAQRSSGRRSYATRLAGAVLGDLLYEQGHMDEAERLLDESYQLGSEGGLVEFLLVTYGTGARIKALRGDHEAASKRLDEGARIADTLGLPRLAARIKNERIRFGPAPTAERERKPRLSDADTDSFGVQRTGADGIATITAELEEDSAIRVSLACGSFAEACSRSENLLRNRLSQDRPRALLRAQLGHVAALSAAGRIDEAKDEVIPLVVKCAEVGLIQIVCDENPQIGRLIALLNEDQVHHQLRSPWPTVPKLFIDTVLADFDRTTHRSPR